MSQSPKASSRAASGGGSAGRKWVVVGLTHAGEQEKDSAILTRTIHRILGQQLDVFVPSLSTQVRSDSQILVYMDGYIFVEYREGAQYMRLRDTSYFQDVLCVSRGSRPVYSLVEDDKLRAIKKDMESIRVVDFEVDDTVRVKSGSNRGLRGIVMDVQDDVVTVKHLTRSKPVVADYKTTYLEKIK